MTQKEMLQQLLNATTDIRKDIADLTSRVNTLEKGNSPKTAKGKGNAVAVQPKVEEKVSLKQTLYSTNIKDYEPKKVNGFYKWGKKGDTVKSRNYRAMMTAYCYAVATKGKALACYDSKGNKVCDFDEIKGAYEKAKAAFQKAYPYTKMADRK